MILGWFRRPASRKPAARRNEIDVKRGRDSATDSASYTPLVWAGTDSSGYSYSDSASSCDAGGFDGGAGAGGGCD
jgi:hypothetical protein